MFAGTVARMAWSAWHCGVVICQGQVEFVASPFARLPTAVRGDRVLRCDRGSTRAHPASTGDGRCGAIGAMVSRNEGAMAG